MRHGRSNFFLLPVIFVITIGEFLFDLATPVGISDWVLYFIPLTLTIYVGTRYFPYLLAGLFSLLMISGLYLSPTGASASLALTGRSIGMIGLWVMALIIAERKAIESALRHTQRALKTISGCNKALVRTASEPELLQQVCRIIVEDGGYRLAWIGFPNDDAEKSVCVAAFAGCDEGYLNQMKINWADTERGRGPVGTCLRESRMVICRNFQTDPHTIPWRQEASKRGFASIIALPLMNENKAFAVLAIYGQEVDAFSKNETQLLNELVEDLTFGIFTQRAHLEQQRAETALENERNLLRTLIDNIPDSVYVRDLTNHYVLANKTLARRMGVANPAEVIGKTDADFFDANHAANGTLVDNEVFAGKFYLNFEQTHQFPDGKQRTILANKVPLLDARGVVTGLVGIGRDITERKLADEKIREQAELLNLAHDAITIRDLNHRITYWNRSATRIYGWAEAEAVGQCIDQLLKLERTKMAEARQLLLENGYWVGEINACTKDGRDVLVESSWTLVRDAEGQPKSILAFSVDITEQRKLEQQVARNQRIESLGTLSSGIAHDLNNVLTPIMMSIDLLKDQAHDPTLTKLIAGLESSTQRGAQLVKQILTFGRGVKGERIPVSLHAVAREIQLFIQETFPKSIHLECNLPAGLWSIIGDPTQIDQVLLNLAINARDAMPNGGKLTFIFENMLIDRATAGLNSEVRSGHYVRIQITDTGMGMTKEISERIFEPFFTTKPTGQGTGLGLSTTLGIVKSHGGFINVYSEPGQGSTFKVHLPARVADEFTEAEPAKKQTLPHGQGELILLVDDEEAICSTIKNILERFGYHVITAANGAEAVSLYTTQGREIAAVITDMHMPIMDGPATIIALQSLNPNVKIIGSSGLAGNGGGAAGVRHFVPKPYSAEKILRTLRDVLENGPEAENNPVI
ncbi:MAG: PAS domain-containing protein [Verrucomicrobiota bacterium]